MICVKCKTVDMQVTARDTEGRPIQWECPKCRQAVRRITDDKIESK